MNSAIMFHHLSRNFRDVEAVHDLTFTVPQGSLCALLGPNGAGKTTTIHMLMNLLQPSSGHVEVFGKDSRQIGPAELARIGYVSENQKLPSWMTVQGMLDFCKPLYPAWDDDLCRTLMKKFDLPPNRKIKALSRGMRLKAAMVAALAYHPELLVLDEPFGGLDVSVREELIEGMLELAEQTGWTLFISSHDLAEIENLVDYIGFVHKGRLLLSQNLEQLQERFREVEITLPQTQNIPSEWPKDWFMPQSSGSVIRYIDSQYREGESEAQVQRIFPHRTNLSFSPMSLRSIFIALTRQQNASVGEGD
jgi:ABC-2 type transport system ATP-binding protein